MDYDVIIAGGSFAGLAAAAQLRGKRVLLIEPHEIGKVPTSACGTTLSILKATGTMDSLCQIHDEYILHLPRRTHTIPLPEPFCTFDYDVFCNQLLAQYRRCVDEQATLYRFLLFVQKFMTNIPVPLVETIVSGIEDWGYFHAFMRVYSRAMIPSLAVVPEDSGPLPGGGVLANSAAS
ncbi:MAG: hypothetical protein HF973_04455 [Chloroflexi bacterium]|nr:hypothetical protein [Chloroflexota bacterium]